MNQELLVLRKQVKQLRIAMLTGGILMLIFVVSSFTRAQERNDIIRTRGIVIEDSAGRDRILIGAPIPSSPNRVRTDTNLVRKYWGKKYNNTDQFMKWYKDYYHGGIGMVVMNENGFDRVAIGDKLADPNSGKRMFEAAGVMWNDKEGWEMGGAGVNTTKDGEARSVIGVDDRDGEAVHLVALEDGTKGLMIGGSNGQLLIGMSKKDGAIFRNKEAFSGVKFFNEKGELKWEQKMNK